MPDEVPWGGSPGVWICIHVALFEQAPRTPHVVVAVYGGKALALTLGGLDLLSLGG